MPLASVTYTFTPGTLVKASEANANFQDLVTFLNGNAIQKDASVAFTAVPSGPATDPVSDNQFTRKAYVDAKAPTVGNVTVPTGNFTYGTTFLNASVFTLTESSKVRVAATVNVSSLESHEMILGFYLFESGASVETAMVRVAVNAGAQRTVSGISWWETLPAGTYNVRGRVDAITIPSGTVIINTTPTNGNKISWERVRA